MKGLILLLICGIALCKIHPYTSPPIRTDSQQLEVEIPQEMPREKFPEPISDASESSDSSDGGEVSNLDEVDNSSDSSDTSDSSEDFDMDTPDSQELVKVSEDFQRRNHRRPHPHPHRHPHPHHHPHHHHPRRHGGHHRRPHPHPREFERPGSDSSDSDEINKTETGPEDIIDPSNDFQRRPEHHHPHPHPHPHPHHQRHPHPHPHHHGHRHGRHHGRRHGRHQRREFEGMNGAPDQMGPTNVPFSDDKRADVPEAGNGGSDFPRHGGHGRRHGRHHPRESNERRGHGPHHRPGTIKRFFNEVKNYFSQLFDW